MDLVEGVIGGRSGFAALLSMTCPSAEIQNKIILEKKLAAAPSSLHLQSDNLLYFQRLLFSWRSPTGFPRDGAATPVKPVTSRFPSTIWCRGDPELALPSFPCLASFRVLSKGLKRRHNSMDRRGKVLSISLEQP